MGLHVIMDLGCVVEHAEGDVPRAAGYIEYAHWRATRAPPGI